MPNNEERLETEAQENNKVEINYEEIKDLDLSEMYPGPLVNQHNLANRLRHSIYGAIGVPQESIGIPEQPLEYKEEITMPNNEERLETETQENNEIKINLSETNATHFKYYNLVNDLRNFTLAATGVPQELIGVSEQPSEPLTFEMLRARKPGLVNKESLVPFLPKIEENDIVFPLNGRLCNIHDRDTSIEDMFNKVKIILGFNINSTDVIKSKLKDTINELVDEDFDCKNDFLKSFLSVILKLLKYVDDNAKFKNIDKSCDDVYKSVIYSKIPRFYYMGRFKYIVLTYDYDDALYDIIIFTLDTHNLILLEDFYYENDKLHYSIMMMNAYTDIKNLIISKELSKSVLGLEEVYILLNNIKGCDLFSHKNNALYDKMLVYNIDHCIPECFDIKILDNNFGILSEKDRIKFAIYLYAGQFENTLGFIFFINLDEVACKIKDGECSFKLLEDNFDIFTNIYTRNNAYSSFGYVRHEVLPNNNYYTTFIEQVNFFEENELNYKEVCNIYKEFQGRTIPYISKGINYDYLNTDDDERLSHFKGDSCAIVPLDKDYEYDFKNLFKEFLIKKFRRSLSDNVLNKVCYHGEFDGLEKLKSRFNKTTIKSLRSVKFANPTVIYLATFYDLSNLNLRTRLYLNYYIYNLNQFNKLKDSPLLKYILKNGNKLSDDNLELILKHIDISGIEYLSNIKDIRLHIIENEMEVEKEKAEDEYEFNFEKDSVCDLVDNPVEKDGYRMRLLDPKDPKVFIVGKLCDCCYHMNGAAEESMIYSILMPNSGNIVIEDIKTKELIATAWVWYDKENDIYVYDNFEFSKDSLLDSCIDIIEEYSMNLPYKNVHVGLDYNEDMEVYFNKLYDYKEAEFVDSDHYGIENDVYSDYVDEYKAVIKSNGDSNRRDPRLI